MAEVRRPISVDLYYSEAREFVESIKAKVFLTSVILDDWNTGNEIRGHRLIYGGDCVVNCLHLTSGSCCRCPLFQLVGKDQPHDFGIKFRTSLCETTDNQLKLFPSKQPCLNCKTIEQYMEAFIRFTATLCNPEELDAEFEWIAGFRVVAYNNKTVSELKEVERKIKEQIAREVILRHKQRELAKRLADKYDLV